MATSDLKIIGNLTRDVELRFTNSGKAVASVGVAVNNYKGPDQEDEVSFIDVTMWQELGENAAMSLHKGDRVMVMGRIRQENWEDTQTGAPRSKLVMVAEDIGPSLRFATAAVTKTPREGTPDQARQAVKALVEDEEFEVF